MTKTWLRQAIVALPLICHSSYRGVIEFLRDLLGVSVSLGTIHNLLQSAARQAGVINQAQDLSGIRVGLHDEIQANRVKNSCREEAREKLVVPPRDLAPETE